MSKYKVLGAAEDGRSLTLIGETDAPDGEQAIRQMLGGRAPEFPKFVTVPARYWADHNVEREQPAPVLVINGRRPSVTRDKKPGKDSRTMGQGKHP